MKYLTIILMVFGLFRSCDGPTGPGDGLNSEYQVYQAVLNELIQDATVTKILDDSTRTQIYNDGIYEHIAENFPDLDAEAVTDFRVKNAQIIALQDIPGVENLVFASKVVERPEHAVNITLSRVGFNAVGDQAIVSFSELWGPLAGHASMLYLVKVDDTWQINDNLMLWIS